MTSVNITSIGQIAVAVSDLESAKRFYLDVLGLDLLFEAPPGLVFFDCGGIRLMVTTQQGEGKDHTTSVIYYKVDDIDLATQAIQSKGVVFEREPQLAAKMPDHELWIGFLRDSDDNLVGIMAERPLQES